MLHSKQHVEELIDTEPENVEVIEELYRQLNEIAQSVSEGDTTHTRYLLEEWVGEPLPES